MSKPRADRLKAELLERANAEGKTQEQIAEKMGISLSTYKRLLKKHTGDWTIDQLTLALRAVDIRMTIRTNYAEAEQ